MQILNQARNAVSAANARKSVALQIEQRKLKEIAAKQEEFAALKKQHARLDADLANAEAALAIAEEEALEQWCIEFANATIRLHNADPLKNSTRVIANIERLRKSMRPGTDTPRGEDYYVHPVVEQALKLQPKPDDLHRPVYELGYGSTPWSMRRRQILDSIHPNPLEAA